MTLPLADPESEAAFNAALNTTRLISLAFALSVGVFGVVVFVAELPGRTGFVPAFHGALTGVAALTAMFGLWFSRRPPPSVPGQLIKTPSAGARPEIVAALNGLVMRTLVSLAAFEAVGMFGLVVAFTSGDPALFAPFAAAAWLLMATVVPRRELWRERLPD